MKTELILIAIVAIMAASLSAYAQDAGDDVDPPGYQEGLCTVAHSKF
jgi:hypothetical protein